MRKISFLDIVLNNNFKLYVKGDQAYTCNLQPWITIFPGSYFIMRIALCIHIWTWHTLHILRINKYIILWRVNYQMWRCQLRVLTSSVLIKLFACYLISLGLTPAYDTSLSFLRGLLFAIYPSTNESNFHCLWRLRLMKEMPLSAKFVAAEHLQQWVV